MENAISVKHLCVSYVNSHALHGINLEVEKGDFLGIIGPNGGGKTTLLNAVLGFVKPDNGEIRINGLPPKKGRNIIGYVPQTANVEMNFPISVTETVMTAFLNQGLHLFKRFSASDRQRALKILKRVGLEDLANRQISELSGGEFQRLLIARALARDPEILLLDEPTSSVDPASTEEIYSILKELNRDGITVVMVTHDLAAVSSVVKKIACINRNLIYYGEPRLTNEICRAMYGCDLLEQGGIFGA